MRRELATFGVMVFFAVSLAATSKAKQEERTGPSMSASAVVAASASSAGAPITTHAMTLPDTAAWKPYTNAATKLTAKTPPGAQVTCTKTGAITVCTVLRGNHILAFGRGGRSVAEIAADLEKPKAGTTTILYQTPDALIVHRNDPAVGEYCEYVTTSEPKLVSVMARVDGVDPAAFKQIALKDQDCLDFVAFAATLKSTP